MIQDFFNLFQYDDAVARLYRAVEVVAQMLLARRNIDTSRIKFEDLPPDWQIKYQESMGDDIGREFRENRNLRNYLNKRNNSIMAHGLEPMTRQIFDELSRETNQLAVKAFPRLGTLKEKSRFPTLKLCGV